MWVKICANTNLEDAALAIRLGADAIGFVFAPSKRRVTAEQVAAITPHLPPGAELVGVFTDASPEEIASTVQTAGLTAVQLHSGSDHRRINRLAALLPETSIIPVVHWEVEDTAGAIRTITDELNQIAAIAPFRRVLIDAKAGGVSGGTGVAFDWHAAQQVFQEQTERGLQPILAGGLSPENVGEAIRATAPCGVDVASGVEASPGRKDPARLASFIQRARGG